MTRHTAERAAWISAAAGLLVAFIAWIVAPEAFPHAWLAAIVCWIGWPLGSLALILIHALTGGRWGFAIRPQLVLGMTTLPLLLPAILPLLFVLHRLYPWLDPAVASGLDNGFYLNLPFLIARGILYCVVWLGLGGIVLWSLRRADPEPILYRVAAPGLILLMLTVTFAAIDATLSLEPHFKSSIYGMLVASEAVLFALSIAVLGTLLTAPPQTPVLHDFGRLMFALVVFWAYLDFMQVLIIWQSDLPHEAAWYTERIRGGWGVLAAIIAILHFALPFFALIWPQVQRSRRGLTSIAAILLAIQIPYAWWVVLPAAGRSLQIADIAAMAAILGAAIALSLRAPALLAVRRHG